MMHTAPERIWDFWPLDGGNPVLWRKPCPFPYEGEADCFEYVRADIHKKLEDENAELKRKLAGWGNYNG